MGKKYSQHMYLTKNLYTGYIQNFYKETRKRQEPDFKMGKTEQALRNKLQRKDLEF